MYIFDINYSAHSRIRSSLCYIVDINECLTVPGACSQGCINTEGNYTCKCNEGYKKRKDGKTCKRIDSM